MGSCTPIQCRVNLWLCSPMDMAYVIMHTHILTSCPSDVVMQQFTCDPQTLNNIGSAVVE